MRRISAVTMCAVLLTATALATTVVPRSIEQLAQDSSLIVHGQAGESWTRWNQGRLYTYTRIQVARTLKGTAGQQVVVKQLGGRTEAYTQKVSGVRHWSPQQEVVLFLRPSVTGDAYVVTGLMQGNFIVRQQAGEKIVSNGVPEAQDYEASTGEVSEYRGTRLTLQELEQRVARAVSR